MNAAMTLTLKPATDPEAKADKPNYVHNTHF